ncbi:hypothetical protein M378DRAFT_158143 [Amanita muscaria Koide BX008]|uniref:Uncharacterized protein n=1 Tax=Amanita muscaria (strain Koide BX008) TaxID=946122 RepID=A0A0C2XHC6_AMAMK|nr:hypothetical protein M378DRAFT_158143 [Amanita muscaria Koide BX008]
MAGVSRVSAEFPGFQTRDSRPLVKNVTALVPQNRLRIRTIVDITMVVIGRETPVLCAL